MSRPLRGDLGNDFDTHVLILINGRPTRESLFGGFNSSLYLATPLTIIERIEVIRGPGSVIYGSNAYIGVINLITKKAESTSGTIQGTAGSFDTYQTTGDLSYVNGDLSLTGAFKIYNEGGWEFTATDIFNDTRTADFNEESTGLFFVGSYKNLRVNTLYTKNSQGLFGLVIPAWDFGSGDPENKDGYSYRLLSDIGYTIDVSEKFKTDLNITYNRFDLGVNVRSFESGVDDWLFEVSNRYNVKDNLNVLFGSTAYYQSGHIGMSVPAYNKSWYGAYTQIDYKPTDNLKLIAGGQFNSIETETDFVPRLGAIYNITDELGAKLLWGKSFRAPYAIETDVLVPGQVGNPNLDTEKLTNLDIQLFYVSSNFELYTTYYDNKSADLIVQSVIDDAGTVSFANLPDDLTGRGISVEGKFIPNGNWYFTGSYSYQANEVTLSGTKIENYTTMPNRMLKLGVSYQSDSRSWSLGMFNSSLSEFNSEPTPFNVNGPLTEINLLTANFKMNATELLFPKMKQDIILNFYGTNILGEEVNYPDFTYRLLNSIPGRPRAAYYGSLIVKF